MIILVFKSKNYKQSNLRPATIKLFEEKKTFENKTYYYVFNVLVSYIDITLEAALKCINNALILC